MSRRLASSSSRSKIRWELSTLLICPIPKHRLGPDEFLLTTIRSHDQFNSTIYGLNDRYRGVFGGRRVLFLNPLDMEARNLRAGQIVDIYSHFEGEVRKAPRFAIVPYAIARRSAAAYCPEANVLVPVRSVAAKSNCPAFKCIRITLSPSDSVEALHFSKADLDRNMDRVVPRVP
jgi:anaerobic selenocysteine-containing dehydrogenase